MRAPADAAGFRIRAAVADDADAISALIVDSVRRHIAGDCTPAGREALLGSMTPQATRERIFDGHRYWVAEDFTGTARDRGLLGVVAIRLPLHLYHLFVADRAQRQGLARALWRHALVALHDQPPGDITVNASRFAVPAYLRLGFVAMAAEQQRDGIPSTPMRFRRGAP